jgi:hypothetical protein
LNQTAPYLKSFVVAPNPKPFYTGELVRSPTIKEAPGLRLTPKPLMLLTEPEIYSALEQAKLAFPHFTDWEYQNEAGGDYFGFALWGQVVPNPEELMSRRFFITLDTYEEQWRGCLTIGMHSYLWSDANMGDAHLLSTDLYDSLEEAIVALKAEMRHLFDLFLSGV